MRKYKFLAQVAACAAGLGLLLPSGALQAANLPAAKSVRQISSDVILTNGTLTGQFVTAEGVAIDGAVVSVRRAGQEVARTTTDARGVFTVNNLRSGVYEVATNSNLEIVRAWDANVAPPSAGQYTTIVSNSAVRGQCDDACDTTCADGGGCGSMLCGAALAVGVAGLATGIVGIAKANDAQDDNDALRDEAEELAQQAQDTLDQLNAQIDDLEQQIEDLKNSI